MRNTLMRTTVAALLAIALAPAAWAGPVMNASVTDVNLRAIDLAPDDGIAAGYDFVSQSVSYVNTIVIGSLQNQQQRTLRPGEIFDDGIAEAQFTSTLEGTAGLGNVSAQLEWDEAQPDPHDATVSSIYTYTAQLTLTAGSALILSGELLQQFEPAGMYDPATSRFRTWLSRTDGDDYEQSVYEQDLRQGGWDGNISGGWDRLSGFAVTITNPGDTSATIDLKLELTSSLRGLSPLSPVPEPAAGSMLAGGLLLLAAASRRRARRRARPL